MRFEQVVIEKYGIYSELSLPLAGDPGLVVIYGPNEAGKSTCLSAVSDFLFGIPVNSTLGQVFGYDQMRLGATLLLSNGNRLTLRRRKGRGLAKTLTNEKGEVIEETVLTSILGPTSRERFGALFGLGHESLRQGGDRLLKADGDVGRLILEAGGGLRALVEKIDLLAAEADRLFATRKAAGRAFYKAKEAFDEAEKTAKADLLTREIYEQTRTRLREAEDAYQKLKDQQRQLTERLSRERRVERVVPLLSSLNRLDETIAAFSPLPALRLGFADTVRSTLASRDKARAALDDAEERRRNLEAEIDALVVRPELLDAEAGIRDAAEKSVQVANERRSRSNRIAELATQEAQLAKLREQIGAAPNANLEPLLPTSGALNSVQRLANEGLELRTKIKSLNDQIAEDEDKLKSLGQRQAERTEAGFDQPFGAVASEFNSLSRLTADLRSRAARTSRIDEEIEQRLRAIGFSTLDELRDLRCPDADAIQVEIDRRADLETELIKHSESIRVQGERLALALAEITRLKEAGEVPTEAAIATARGVRDSAWAPIRETYLSDDTAAIAAIPLRQRSDSVVKLENSISEADQLSDRKSIEAQRITDLAAAEERRDEANVAIKSATQAKTGLEERRTELGRQFADAWPQATARADDLSRLKSLLSERESILTRADGVQNLREEADRIQVELNPGLERLALAEQHLGITTDTKAALQARIQAVTRRIAVHENTYADYRTDRSSISEIGDQLERRRRQLETLLREQSNWLNDWRSAVREIQLSDEVALDTANEVVTEWSAARGVLTVIRNTRKRLDQFEADERELKSLIDTVAPQLNFKLPDDSVAAAKMLDEQLRDTQKASAEKAGLLRQLAQRTKDSDLKQRELAALERALASLCTEAEVDETSVVAVAERHDELLDANAKRVQIMEQIGAASDGRSMEALGDEWGSRDLDAIRAGLGEIGTESERIEKDIETALATLQDRRRDLERFQTDSGINAAVAERERAAAEMRQIVDRYLEVTLAKTLLEKAVDRLRGERQDPLIKRAGELFALTTRGSFSGIGTDIDGNGTPVVIGKRAAAGDVSIDQMSDGTRDQIFLAFRLASIEHYCAAAEPLPFIADDLLVHFDDDRSAATIALLAEFGRTTQVLLFTHHRSVRDMAGALADRGEAKIVELV